MKPLALGVTILAVAACGSGSNEAAQAAPAAAAPAMDSTAAMADSAAADSTKKQ